jgi:hypothetical protein
VDARLSGALLNPRVSWNHSFHAQEEVRDKGSSADTRQ